MRRGLPALAAALLVVSPTIALAQMPSRDRALEAPIGDLARETLAALAPSLVEMSRPDFTGLAGPGGGLRGLIFATRPRSAGNPGICAATVVYISPEAENLSPITTRETYKVVGPTASLPDMWNDDYDAWLKAACVQAGPVISATTSDFGSPTFFEITGPDPNVAWYGARALELAITEAREGRLEVECIDEPWDDEENGALCIDGGSTIFGQLKLDRLRRVEIAPCEDDKERDCLSADLLREGNENMELLWSVTLEVRVRNGPDGSRDVEVPAWAKMSADYVIYD